MLLFNSSSGDSCYYLIAHPVIKINRFRHLVIDFLQSNTITLQSFSRLAYLLVLFENIKNERIYVYTVH